VRDNDIKILNSKTLDPKRDEQKKKIELIALAVLVPILLYLMVTTFAKKPKKPAPPAAVRSSAALSEGDPSKSGSVPEPVKGPESGWGSNPFSPRSSDGGNPVAIQLQGIVVKGQGEAYALVNNGIVKVGSRVVDNTVKEISQDRVVLLSDSGEETVLRR